MFRRLVLNEIALWRLEFIYNKYEQLHKLCGHVFFLTDPFTCITVFPGTVPKKKKGRRKEEGGSLVGKCAPVKVGRSKIICLKNNEPGCLSRKLEVVHRGIA